MHVTSVVMAGTFLVLAAVAVAGVVRASLDAWQPFPPVVMASVAVGLALLGIGWLALRRGAGRFVEALVAIGSLAGLVIGAVGIWGTNVILSDCPGGMLASSASVPAGYCSTIGTSLLIGLYLIAIGVVSLVSLVVQVRRV